MFNIGDRIIELRNAHSISANKLSIAVNVDPSTINKIEKGTAKPSIDLIFKICDYFEITPEEFFHNNSEPILSSELHQLISALKMFTPEQLSRLNDFIKSLS